MLVAIISLAVLFLDILSKYLSVVYLLPTAGDVVVIPHVLSFSYVQNKGAAWGILSNHRWVFMSLSVLLIIALILLLKYSGVKHKLFLISVAMILGGGIGNMIDRIFLGYVVEFIKGTFINFPVFNIADCGVVVGTILLAVYLFFFDKEFFSKKTDGVK